MVFLLNFEHFTYIPKTKSTLQQSSVTILFGAPLILQMNLYTKMCLNITLQLQCHLKGNNTCSAYVFT